MIRGSLRLSAAGGEMALIPVELPWTKTEVLEGTTVGELLDSGPTDALDVVAACVNRRVVALDFPIECPSLVEPVGARSREGEEVVWRTAALLLHGVARRLFPKARLHVGQSLRGVRYRSWCYWPLAPWG
jgi:hypothetical protein